jgi:molybdenum cofactor cytidylyltransferase
MRRRDSLPVLDPPGVTAERREIGAVVHGVVLAAGTSSRYGERNKLLESVDGETLVRHAVTTLLETDVAGVTVVVGHQAERVADAVADLDVAVRENEAFADGQSTSVAAGVRAAQEREADAVVLALGDMPDVSVESCAALLSTYDQGAGDALAAAYDSKRGNPVLFDRRHFADLLDIDGDVGGREILLTDPDAVAVETGDPAVLRDVDRPGDV